MGNISCFFTAYSMKTDIVKQFEMQYRQLAGGVFRYVYFKVSGYELAQDITEETFVRYWKVLTKKKSIDSHKALLYFIAKGLIIDTYRKKSNKKISLETIDERLLAVQDTMEDTVSQNQELEQVYANIKKLKKDYQDILFLHFVEDFSIKEIAYIQKKSENSLRVLLHRSLKALKEKL
ncbi:MAG TPA: sigma-70 family RNA polymerase sigma factor [Candidatus Saccharimonadales bacterium]|nr:sigma-70 family RNA polymerase sigma factor [Candidatus Saccharimonadales bacterium]